jgi:tetratricopeptide (TPR) repeat protein
MRAKQSRSCQHPFEHGINAIPRSASNSDDNFEVAAALNSIGLVLFSQGVYGLAERCFGDSLRVRTKILGPDHHDVAILWYNIATIYLESGDDDRAINCYKETLRVERTALGEKHHDVVLTLQHLGLVHQQRGEIEQEGRMAVAKLLNLIGNIHLQQANIAQGL